MSTANNDITYTNGALEILSCFMGSFDDLVLEVAEKIARSEAQDPKAPICITSDHVKRAGIEIINILRRQWQQGQIDDVLADLIDETESCLGAKSCDDDE